VDLKVAAVVVTYNRKFLLAECLNALLNQTRKPDLVIIIDNGSSDGTNGELRRRNLLENPIIKYIRLPVNTGGAGGFYEGVKIGYEKKFDWLWLMDDDAQPRNDALEILLKAIEDGVVGITSLKVDTEGKIEKIHRGWFYTNKFKPSPLKDKEYLKEECPIGYSSFVGFLIKREAIEKVGFPNKDFFIWFDDVEYCLRLLSVGSLKMVTKSIIVHKDQIKREQTIRIPIKEYWKMYYGVRNRTYILRKYFSHSFIVLFFVVLIKGIVRIYLFEDRKLFKTKIFFRAWHDGIKMKLGKLTDPAMWLKN